MESSFLTSEFLILDLLFTSIFPDPFQITFLSYFISPPNLCQQSLHLMYAGYAYGYSAIWLLMGMVSGNTNLERRQVSHSVLLYCNGLSRRPTCTSSNFPHTISGVSGPRLTQFQSTRESNNEDVSGLEYCNVIGYRDVQLVLPVLFRVPFKIF